MTKIDFILRKDLFLLNQLILYGLLVSQKESQPQQDEGLILWSHLSVILANFSSEPQHRPVCCKHSNAKQVSRWEKKKARELANIPKCFCLYLGRNTKIGAR